MLENQFYDWLLKKYNPATANARKANCLNVSKYEGDLDQHFEKDACRSLIEKLSYSTDDEKHNRPAKHKIPICGNVRAGSSTLKQAINLYVEFRNEMKNNTKAEKFEKPVEEKPKTEQTSEKPKTEATKIMAWREDQIGRRVEPWPIKSSSIVAIYDIEGKRENFYPLTIDEVERMIYNPLSVKWYREKLLITCANGEKRLYNSPNPHDYKLIE